MIDLKNINFAYKNINVINDVKLHLEKGKIYAFLGHNGAGKTTLFKLIIGLLKPKSGDIKKDNLTISYMPYNDALYENLTVKDNLAFRAECYGIKLSNDAINDYLESFDILDLKNTKIKELSSGQKKRVSLIASCVVESDIIVLDEPTNGVDPETMIIIINFLKGLNAKGASILFSSHNLDFVESIADEVIILAKGSICYENKIDLIKDDLKNVYLKYCKGGAI